VRTLKPFALSLSKGEQLPAEALFAEQQIKGWSRRKKEAMMCGDWTEVSRLAKGPERDGVSAHPSTSSGRTGNS
jgi:putative endonuclease